VAIQGFNFGKNLPVRWPIRKPDLPTVASPGFRDLRQRGRGLGAAVGPQAVPGIGALGPLRC
jgi:hypothetical protein